MLSKEATVAIITVLRRSPGGRVRAFGTPGSKLQAAFPFLVHTLLALSAQIMTPLHGLTSTHCQRRALILDSSRLHYLCSSRLALFTLISRSPPIIIS